MARRITINQYQVERGVYHNTRVGAWQLLLLCSLSRFPKTDWRHWGFQMGVTELCKPTQGDFLAMPFADNTFDAAYAIEATCHAAKVRTCSLICSFLHFHTQLGGSRIS